jgi:predicted transcriptional regulator
VPTRATNSTKAINKLGDLERAVMEQVWALGEAGEPSVSVRQVHEALLRSRDLAYTTVMTVMTRLADAGLLVKERGTGRAYLYAAAGTREELTASSMLGQLQDLPSADRRAAMLHFLGDATAEEIADLKAALAEVEERHRRSNGSRR